MKYRIATEMLTAVALISLGCVAAFPPHDAHRSISRRPAVGRTDSRGGGARIARATTFSEEEILAAFASPDVSPRDAAEAAHRAEVDRVGLLSHSTVVAPVARSVVETPAWARRYPNS